MGIRPSFISAWNAAKYIYDEKNTIKRVKDVIGGRIKENFEIPYEKGGWVNSCAVRMSYVLNHTGHPIPRNVPLTVSGGDKKWYYYRVKDLIRYLRSEWGEPDSIISYPKIPVEKLQGKKGLILFEVSEWQDAAGHATFWDGIMCSDHCYFNDPGNINYITNAANFWELS